MRAAVASRPLLCARCAAPIAQEMTLEEELAAGKITQEEYESLLGGIDEEDYLKEEEEMEAEAPQQMSAEAAKIMKGMTSESGVEFAPWMKVDAEAIAKAKKEREARKARAAANAAALRNDAMLIDPQAAELGG